MSPDELKQPLGNRPASSKARWNLPILPMVVIALTALIGSALLWILLVDNPLGGEPVATARIEQPAAKVEDAPAAAKPREQSEAPAERPQTVTIIDGKSGARTEISIQDSAPSKGGVTAAPDMWEESRHGRIPRIAADGTRPLDAYARGARGDAAKAGPSIAIVVTGLGVSASTTRDTMAKLPPAVTLAFTPQANGLGELAAKASGVGHELLLQVPMEPFDYPDNDPGPQALLTSLSTDQNVDRLHWSLSRMSGYVGVANFMGARFTSNEEAFAPILAEIGRRGLLYFDDGTSSRSLTRNLSGTAANTVVAADIVLDARPSWADIDAALERLERIARERNYAIGVATALPISIERIARWAKAADSRGIRIVPLTAVAGRARQS